MYAKNFNDLRKINACLKSTISRIGMIPPNKK